VIEYTYCPRCGAKVQDTFLHGRIRPVCPSCGYIVYLDPKVGAGVVVEREGRVVLVRRGMNPKRGYWSLPAGYVERDEAPEETAVRETWEETGLHVALDNLLGVYSFPHESTGSRGVLVLYAAHIVGGELRAGDDAEEVGTFAPEEVPEDIAFDTHQQALKDWLRAKAIVYRRATAQEAQVVATLNSQYRAEIGRDYPSDASAETTLYVALDRGTVVGFAVVSLHGWNDTANLDQIFVLPTYRRWGIATKLISSAIDLAREKRMRLLLTELPAVNPALAFYLKAGFRVVGFLDGYRPPADAETSTALFLAFDLSDHAR
jgi:ADP-ribose pyrophosphatase YjhB (NUDIX family)/N-acetylglutamate synthase-like GNAT family acetyltransferase